MTRRSLTAVTALAALTVVLAGCSGSSSSEPAAGGAGQDCSTSLGNALGAVVAASNQYESGAQQAAQTDGPPGLAAFAMENRTMLLDAGQDLKAQLAACPDAGNAEEIALAQAIADGAIAYGQTLSDVGDAVGRCPKDTYEALGAFDCWESAYYNTDPQGSAKRQQFRDAVDAARAAAQ